MNPPNLTNEQLNELDSLFTLVSERQIKDFGNISASNKADGSLITSCDLWSDKTIVDGLASIAPKVCPIATLVRFKLDTPRSLILPGNIAFGFFCKIFIDLLHKEIHSLW